MWPDLRFGVSVSDREGLLVTGVNGTLMARRTAIRPALMAASWTSFVLLDSCHPSGRGTPNQGSRSDRGHARVSHYEPVSSLLTAVRGQLKGDALTVGPLVALVRTIGPGLLIVLEPASGNRWEGPDHGHIYRPAY